MRQYAATDQKHGNGSCHRKAFHEPRSGAQYALTQVALKAAPCADTGPFTQVKPAVIKLDDAGHQAVDPYRHDNGNTANDRELGGKGAALHRAQRDGDNLG